MRTLLCLSILVLTGCSDSKPRSPEIPKLELVAPADTFATVCAVCHGESGEGKVELQAPAIAGLPGWYVKEQIVRFREGFRGTEPNDIAGAQMKAIALSLAEDQIDSVAGIIEALPPKPTRIVAYGDGSRGRSIFAESCMACHRFNGKGERAFHSAPLVTLNPEYLQRQLHNYAKGWRGAAEQDFYGHKMVAVAEGLSDRDIIDLVRYMGELAHGDDPRKALNW